MLEQLPVLNRFLKHLQNIPYLASKNMYRVMHYFLEMSPEERAIFQQVLREAQEGVIKCTRCWAWQERGQQCPMCDDPKRDHTVLCVVETWQDLFALERAGGYRGDYHVLGGVLHPLAGVTAAQLTIKELVLRIAGGSYREIILALNQTPEGDATIAFISRALQNSNVPLTSLARGLPVGSSLEFTDRLTLHKALVERRGL